MPAFSLWDFSAMYNLRTAVMSHLVAEGKKWFLLDLLAFLEIGSCWHMHTFSLSIPTCAAFALKLYVSVAIATFDVGSYQFRSTWPGLRQLMWCLGGMQVPLLGFRSVSGTYWLTSSSLLDYTKSRFRMIFTFRWKRQHGTYSWQRCHQIVWLPFPNPSTLPCLTEGKQLSNRYLVYDASCWNQGTWETSSECEIARRWLPVSAAHSKEGLHDPGLQRKYNQSILQKTSSHHWSCWKPSPSILRYN